MASGFRKTMFSWGGKVMLVLLISSFGLWGITDYINPGAGHTSVALVGGEEISAQTLQRELRTQRERFRRAGLSLDADQARALGVVRNSLETLVQRRLITLSADNLGLRVDDEAIRRQIHGNPAFQGPYGRFDRRRFDQAIRSIGLTEAGYLARLRSELIRRQFLSNVEFGPPAPKSLIAAVHAYRAERRTAQILAFAHARIGPIRAPSETQLAAFHKKQAARFTAPEYRKLTLVRLQAADLAGEIQVDEARIREEYDNRLDEFSQPERRTLQQILLADGAAARAAHARLEAGEDFLKVAKEAANMSPAEVGIGTFAKNDLPLEVLADAAFALAKGAAGRPVKSDLGWHILKVTGITSAKTRPFEKVRAKLKKDIQIERAVDRLFERANKLEDALGGGADLEEAAARYGLAIKKIAAVNVAGRTPSDAAALNPATDGAILKAAFETALTDESPLTESGDTGYFILRVDAITPPALKPLAAVRARVAAAWKRTQQAKQAGELAKKALEAAKGLKPWKDIAKEFRAKLRESKPFMRSGAGLARPLPGGLIADLFKTRRGNPVLGASAGAHFVARVKEVLPADPAMITASRRELTAQLSQNLQNDLINQLVSALRKHHGVTVNQQALGAIN